MDSVDVFSFHAYGGVSERCKGKAKRQGTLSEEWLARMDGILAFYEKQRDAFDPGKPTWLTETGETACGEIRGRLRFWIDSGIWTS